MPSKLTQTLLLAFTAYVVISASVFTVDEGEKAIVFELGDIARTYQKPGLKLKVPFLQSVRKYDGRLRTLDNETDNFLTVEKKNVEVDYFVKWRIQDLNTYYKATGRDEQIGATALLSSVNKVLRDQIGARTIQQVVSSERDEMMTVLRKNAALQVKELGVEIMDVRIKSINLPKQVSDSVYERMRAERTRVAADLRAKGAEEAEKIRSNADREVQVTLANAYRDAEKLRGEGDSKSGEIYAKAYSQDAEFYRFYRSMNAYRSSFNSKSDVLVLEPNGSFFQSFK
jgi:membrane protease subunit HflC